MRKFDFSIVKNPEILQENCLPAHSDHICMSNWFEAEENSLRMSLDGLWKFSYAKNMNLAVAGFEEEAYCCRGWDEICVPSQVQMDGYEVPEYIKTTHPWETVENVLPGEIPVEFNPVASYVKYFSLPVNMRGERVCISFQGVEGGFALWLNGHYVGYSENIFAPVEFELTPYLKEGENKLAIRVWKWTSGSWNENQGCAPFLGVFRDVYLYMVPKTHLWDVQVIPELSDDFSEGNITIITTTCGKGEIEIRLLDDTMQEVLAGVLPIEEGEEDSDEIQSGIAGVVYEPKLWSAEAPNLYMLQLEVRDENGDLTEITSVQVGFRRFEMQDGNLVLNGKKVVLKGAKHFVFSKESGFVPNKEAIENDIVTMKQNNINTICTSQYSTDLDTYELCDMYGLYVITENRMESCCKTNHPAVMTFAEGMEEPAETMVSEMVQGFCKLSSYMQEVKYKYQNILVEFTEKTFTVWNKHMFTNTDVFSAFVILQKDGEAIAQVALPISVRPFEKQTFDIPQQILGIMDNLKIASAVHEGDVPEFAVTVSFKLPADNMWGKRGHEVAYGQYVYKKEVTPYSAKESIEVVKGQNNILVKGDHFKALFSRFNGGLISYVYGGVEMLKNIPLPNFWRVPRGSEAEHLMQQGYAQWKLASMYATTKCQDALGAASPVVEALENSVKLTYTFYMPTVPASSCQVCYHVFGDGTIETTMVYDSVEGLCDMPEFGILFKMDAGYNRLRWYGFGPEEIDIDYIRGGKLGVYVDKVEDDMAKYFDSQKCGNKYGVRFAEVTDVKGRGLRFFGDELCFCALPYTPHELENASCACELPKVCHTVVRVAKQQVDISKKKVFTFCFRGV